MAKLTTLVCANPSCNKLFDTTRPYLQKFCCKACCEKTRLHDVYIAPKDLYISEAARKAARDAAKAQGVKLSLRELERVGK